MPAINFNFNIIKDEEKRLIVLRQTPDESLEHIILKLLAYLLFFDDNLRIEAEAIQHYKPDLVKFDEWQSWKVTKWIDCGVIDAKKLLKISKHNRQAEIYIFKSSEGSAQSLKDRIAKQAPKISNVHYCVFNKEKVEIIQALMVARNNIVIKNYFGTCGGHLESIFNNETMDIQFTCL